MTTVKICGLRPGDDLSFASIEEVSHVGFIFVPASRRFVTPKEARPMVADLAGHASAVGVFVNASEESVLRTATDSGIQVAQLHGAETPTFCGHLRASKLKVWKALSVPTDQPDIDSIARTVASYAGFVDAVLLDASPPKTTHKAVTGGHGQSFDWTLLPCLYERLTRTLPVGVSVPLWIAGGLTPSNVQGLLRVFCPAGVDVSSGVELQGRKSLERILAMTEAVKQHV